jgi:hypothetical protein
MSKATAVCDHARSIVRDEFDFLPLSEVTFLWNHDRNDADEWPEEAFVALPQNSDIERLNRLPLHELSSSTGACTSGWPDHFANNPALIFGQVLMMNWANEEERISAVAEFAKIDELTWAREILRGMAYQIGAFANEDEERDIWKPITNITEVERFRDKIIQRLK